MDPSDPMDVIHQIIKIACKTSDAEAGVALLKLAEALYEEAGILPGKH